MNLFPHLGLRPVGLLTLLFTFSTFAGANEERSRIESAFLPKREVGQPEFLKANPEADGRGVVIAIFDTGVDPAAAGMAVTTTGERKVLDIIDATGSGDVDTSHKAMLNDAGHLEALSGRKLHLPADIVNPSGEFRLGLKRAADIMPPSVLRRLRAHEAAVLLAEISEEQAAIALNTSTDSEPEKAPADMTRAEQDAAARESLRIQLLDSVEQHLPEIHYDCVLWNDGEAFQVLIDTDRDGDLSDETQLRPYGIAGEYAIFDPVTNLTFGIQVYAEGDVLSIVTVNGTHGTHVAAIAAAHDPDNPQRDGVAPGAQIVSIRIGDPRVGGSYGDGERRAIALAAQAGVDIINVSWGGTSYYQDGKDEYSDAYNLIVERYGIFAVISAGNDGPALSTLGSAGGEASKVLGVGAYVSPEMGEVLYSTLEPNVAASLQFSSRGPSKDGDWGVDITAPGAAFASYSGESLQGFEMINGTSMSAPCAAGVTALVLSAAKQENLKADPARLRAALMLGAQPVPNEAVYTVGGGLINAPGGLAKLRALQDEPAFGAFYNLDVSRGSFNPDGRGLYVRETDPEERLRVVVGVEPAWIEAVTSAEKVAFETPLTLHPTADWIEVPEVFHLVNAENFFIAHVTVPNDASTHGQIYTAEIEALIPGKEELGPVFSVPVTVVRGIDLPVEGEDPSEMTLTMKPAQAERLFLNVPLGADHLHVKVRHRAEDPIARRYVIHGFTLSQELPMYASGDPRYIRLDEGESELLSFPTMGGEVMELTVYQYWSSVGASEIDLELEWSGLGLEYGGVLFTENTGWANVPFRSFKDETLEVSAEVDRGVHVYMPASAEIVPFDERAILPPSPDLPAASHQKRMRQIFELNFEEAVSADILFPLNYDRSEYFGGGFMEVVHESGKLLYAGTASGERFIDFPKGKSFVVRSYNQAMGEKLGQTKPFPLLMQRSVEGATTMPVYANLRERFIGSAQTELDVLAGRPGNLLLKDGVLAAAAEMSPSPDYFTGSISFQRNDGTELGSQYIVYYAGTPAEDALKPAPEAKEAEDIRDASQVLADRLYEQRLGFVKEQRAAEETSVQEERQSLLEALIRERPEDPEPLFEKALSLSMEAGLTGEWWSGPEVETPDTSVVEGVQELLQSARALADPEAVAVFLGAPPTAAPGDVEARHAIEREEKEINAARDLLVLMAHLEADLALSTDNLEGAWAALQEAGRWESGAGETTKALQRALYEAEELWGLVLEELNAELEEDPLNTGLREKRIEVYTALGWSRFAEFESRELAILAAGKARLVTP
jgi:tripeptidyl-peptidase-2